AVGPAKRDAVRAGGEGGRGGGGGARNAVTAVGVDDELPVDVEQASVVGGQGEGVTAGRVNVQEALPHRAVVDAVARAGHGGGDVELGGGGGAAGEGDRAARDRRLLVVELERLIGLDGDIARVAAVVAGEEERLGGGGGGGGVGDDGEVARAGDRAADRVAAT